MLPCERELRRIIKEVQGSNLEITRFGRDYAKTLSLWAERFDSQASQVQKMGFSAEFLRLWNFYLGYCEGAFRAGQTDVIVMAYRQNGGS